MLWHTVPVLTYMTSSCMGCDIVPESLVGTSSSSTEPWSLLCSSIYWTTHRLVGGCISLRQHVQRCKDWWHAVAERIWSYGHCAWPGYLICWCMSLSQNAQHFLLEIQLMIWKCEMLFGVICFELCICKPCYPSDGINTISYHACYTDLYMLPWIHTFDW